MNLNSNFESTKFKGSTTFIFIGPCPYSYSIFSTNELGEFKIASSDSLVKVMRFPPFP